MLAALTLVLSTSEALAQSDTESAQARAVLLEQGSFAKMQDMDFGRIVKSGSAGTVLLAPSAAPTCTTTGGLVHSNECQAAMFAGDASFLFLLRVTRPPGGQIFLNGPGGATMRLNNFTFGAASPVLNLGSSATEQRYLILTANGSFAFYVGGTLHVAANQAGGNYNGTFVIQVNYN